MSIGIGITTRHRPELLRRCLECLARGTRQADRIVVSDDSNKPELLEATERTVREFPKVSYVRGPRRGVCANRNWAAAQLGDVDFVGFLDDDGLVEPEYLEIAVATYETLGERASRTILTGTRVQVGGPTDTTCRIGFRGYFEPSATAEVAGASYSVFPRRFIHEQPWDEKIFFGYEDAELSLRARRSGFDIVHVPKMVVVDAAHGQSTVLEGSGRVNGYDFLGEAARLYVGVKRYKDIETNYAKLAVFVPLFFAQIMYSLTKRQSLHLLPKLVRQSNVIELFRK